MALISFAWATLNQASSSNKQRLPPSFFCVSVPFPLTGSLVKTSENESQRRGKFREFYVK